MALCMRRNQDCSVKVDLCPLKLSYKQISTALSSQELKRHLNMEKKEKRHVILFLIAFKKFFNNFKHVDNALQQHSALVSTYNSPIVGAPP